MKQINQDHLSYCASIHQHLCPRQILGIRIGLMAQDLLAIALPQINKRLFAVVETDGCFVSGITAATGCRVERRTMRIINYGKVAVTFIDTINGRAWRIYPQLNIRNTASQLFPNAKSRWHAQLEAYQMMEDDTLLQWGPVMVHEDILKQVGAKSKRVECVRCGEEVINQRFIDIDDNPTCRACADHGYYVPQACRPHNVITTGES